jgi:hypothetical protein
VLAYGYDWNGPAITFRVYDPNQRDADDIYISIDTSNPAHTTQIESNVRCDPIRGFFFVDYNFVDPSSISGPPWPRPLRWASLGGVGTSDPGAVLQTGGRLVVFVRGTDNNLYHRWQMTENGEWAEWASIGAPPGGATSGPDVALNAPGGLVVFARGGDNAIWHAWQDQPDGEWS